MPLFSQDQRRNPFPLYEELRLSSPALYDARSDLWCLFDYDSVKQALTNTENFSSAASPGGPTSKWLIFLDAPQHTRLRRLILRAFTPRAVEALEPRVRELSRGLLEPLLTRGECDLVSEYAMPLPLMVIAQMLGAPAEDYPQFRRWSDVVLGLTHTVAGDERAAQAVAAYTAVINEMRQYLADILRARERDPQNDLLTRLAESAPDGEQLSFEDILGFFQILLIAGHETTTNLISNAVLTLVEHPDELTRLRSRPELLPNAIEEVLRYRSPVQVAFRKTRCDVQIAGGLIPAHKLVLAVIGSANRDGRAFERANVFDVQRTPNPHVAFGHGAHFCIGAALARLEAKIALGDLLTLPRTLELPDRDWEPREAFHVHGPSHLALSFR